MGKGRDMGRGAGGIVTHMYTQSHTWDDHDRL